MPRKPGEKILEKEHKERARDYNKARPARHEIYNSARWRSLRELKMSLSPLCEQCEREGRITAGELVDHIIPIECGGAKFALENLQTLCRACHNRKHSSGNGGGAVEKSSGLSKVSGVQPAKFAPEKKRFSSSRGDFMG